MPSFRVTVAGQLDETWLAWLEADELQVQVLPDQGVCTILTCSVTDQAGLRGLLMKLWDTNQRIVSVLPVEKPFSAEKSTKGE